MYSSILLLCVALIPALTVAETFTFKGHIPLDGLLYNVTLHPSSRVVLDHSSKYALIRQDGSFELSDVEEGTHVLTPRIPDYNFPSYLLTLTPSSPSTPAESELESLSGSTPLETLTPHIQLLYPEKSPLSPSNSPSIPYPLMLRPLGQEDYYTKRGGANVLGMLKSPVVLMMLASGAMMFALPKIMASVDNDPELKKEMAEARKRMNGMTGGLTGLLASGGSGGVSAAPAPAAVEPVAVSTGNKVGTPKNSGAQKRKGK